VDFLTMDCGLVKYRIDGNTNAREHLPELGAPEPRLPPFDESKFEPLPDVELNPRMSFGWRRIALLERIQGISSFTTFAAAIRLRQGFRRR
jgi:hypothetical protein